VRPVVRTPFDIVRLHDEMLEHSILSNECDVLALYRQYLTMLSFFGWSQIDYENELLKIIDQEWIEIHRQVHG